MATSHAYTLSPNAQLPEVNAAQSQHEELFGSSDARQRSSYPQISTLKPTLGSHHENISHQNTSASNCAQPRLNPTPFPTGHSPGHQPNSHPSPGALSLDDIIWAFVWQIIYSKIDLANRNPGPSEPTTDMQIAMAIKKDLHLYRPWESMILQKAIDVMLTPVEEGEEEESDATSPSIEGFARDSEATRETSPDPILEHMHRVNMRKRKEHPNHEAEDRCRYRPRRRKGSPSSAAFENPDIQSYFMKERDRREGMEYFMFFGDLKDPAKLQEVLCTQQKPVLYPVSASNFRVEVHNGIHQLIHTPNKTDVVDLMICEVTGWEAKTRLGDYTQSKEMGELGVIDTAYALRLLRGEKC